jgi:beta-ureidopropionase / N-carbamoyl-L-amino-acid hydrolase
VVGKLFLRQPLDKANVPIGVVEGIVGIDIFGVEIRGFANHAGTTPMPERRNALLAAAKLIEAVQDVATGEPGRQVGTVGQLQVSPNAPNVVPGLVNLSIELRDLSAEKIARLGDEIQQRAQRIATQTGTDILIKKVEHDPPAIASPEIQVQIELVAACPWRIYIVASFERNVTMLHWWKPQNGIFGRHR